MTDAEPTIEYDDEREHRPVEVDLDDIEADKLTRHDGSTETAGSIDDALANLQGTTDSRD